MSASLLCYMCTLCCKCRICVLGHLGVSALRFGEGVKSLSAAMCSAGLSGYVLPGQSSTLGCVNSGAGTFSCQAPLPVEQRTWLSAAVSLSGAKCRRSSANRLWSFAEKWAGNGSAGLGYNLLQHSQQPWRRSHCSQIASNGSNGDLHVRHDCQSLTFYCYYLEFYSTPGTGILMHGKCDMIFFFKKSL